MTSLKRLIALSISCFITILAVPEIVNANLSRRAVINGVTAGISFIHGNVARPKIYYNIPRGYASPCGPIDPTNAGYCSLNHAIYIGQNLQNIAYYRYGDAALAYLVAHEYAHGMQVTFRFNPKVTVLSELQADCLAGVYLAAIPNIIFDGQDIREIVAFVAALGNYEVWHPQWHGTPEMRAKSVLIGLSSGKVESCRF